MTDQPISLSTDSASEHGISTLHERMPNGELRFRLLAKDGSAYIRTVSGSSGAWQRSHYHKHLRETYVLERGWMVLAEWDRKSQNADFKKYGPGEVITTQPLKPHNVYLAGDSVLHTIKHGGGEDADWHAVPELDSITHPISETTLLQMTTDEGQ